jgi:serine/threonine protein kinase/tetratricopeptide (TPR) repeat protein
MISQGVISSVRLQKEAVPCPQCGSTSRVGRGLCLNCLLYRGLGEETYDNETLESVLDEVDVRDADWRLGNYQILEEIGRGGMGVIYRARQRHSRRIVALKRILAYHADSRETLVRFRREAEAAASLDHPNILPIYEVSEGEDGLPFFSMKLATGGSLLDSHVALHKDPRRSVALMAKVSRAVQYAHAQGILHRDLKPGNILLDGHGEPMVSDFGLAKWLDTTSDLTRTLTVFGTPGYIAPEQAHGPAAGLKPTADVYSLGAILFDLLAGRPPFLGEHAFSVIQQAADKPAPKLRGLKPTLDRDLETICARCLEREPKARYQSASDLAEDLERWLEGRPIIARPVSPVVRTWRWSKRNPKLAGSVAACLALGIAATGFQIQNHASERLAAMSAHSIAIEPFLDLDTAQWDTSLSYALAGTLQRELSKRGPAQVTSLSAARSMTMDEASGGDRSNPWRGTRTAVLGTKRIHDGKFRLSLRLVNAADGKVLYKKIIETVAPDHTGDLVASAIGRSLYTILDTKDLTAVELVGTDPGWRDQSTRELLMAGKVVGERRTLSDKTRAVELFKTAVKAQPESVLAQSGLADAQYGCAFLTGDSQHLSAAQSSAQMALRLDPNSAEAHRAMSLVLFQQGRFPEALEEALTACELVDGDYNRLPNIVAGSLKAIGEPVRALSWFRLGNTDRPGLNDFMIGDCFADLADDQDAAAEYRRASTLVPELPEGWMGLCRLALLQNDFAAAHKISSENWTRYRDYVLSEEMAAQVEFFSRNFPDAERLYDELASKDPNGGGAFYGCVSYQSALGYLRLTRNDKSGREVLEEARKKELANLKEAPYALAALYTLAAIESTLGEKESALKHLEEAAGAGWIDFRSLGLDPRFDVLHGLKDFSDLLDAMKNKVASLRGAVSTVIEPQIRKE